MISLTYIGLIDLCVLCVSVVPSTPSPAGLYLRIDFALFQRSRDSLKNFNPSRCKGFNVMKP
ncbi:MAG: hypothetical protein EWV43_06895 [Microcystis panniformis Mp_MB_F_20080800_S26D]|nr:MAG: hypothetical protein EWV43_06895 [Microcystis panniformis Mp_MB_F_20080800_S26D]